VSHPTFELTALVDGALPPDRAREVRRHVAACAACAAEEGRLRDALALLAALPPAPAPSPFFAARLEQRLSEERPAPGGWIRSLAVLRWRFAVPAAALATVALVAAGTVRARGRERALAEHLELLEDYDAIASLGDVRSADDVEVVAHLEELERGGRP
jgi:anti-sigma factor RsiW